MKKDLNKKRKKQAKLLLKDWLEFKVKKKILKQNMTKKERLTKNLKKIFKLLFLKKIEKQLSKRKNMKILRDNNKILLKLMKLRIKNYRIITINLTKHYLKENQVLENKSNIGKVNTMKLKDNMQTFKVNLKRKKHFGKVSLNSQRDKKIKPKKTMKMLLSNSNKQLINSKKLIWMEKLNTNIIKVWLCSSLKINSRKKSKSKQIKKFKIKCNFKVQSKDQKRTIKILMKDQNCKEAVNPPKTTLLRKNLNV